MLYVKKKDGESFESLIRRFSKKTLESGRITQAKKVMFKQKPLNFRAKQEKALRREEVKKVREYMRRIGKLEEYDKAAKKGRRR